MRGKGTGYLYKTEWVDEFLEQQAIQRIEVTSSKLRIHKSVRKYKTKVPLLVH